MLIMMIIVMMMMMMMRVTARKITSALLRLAPRITEMALAHQHMKGHFVPKSVSSEQHIPSYELQTTQWFIISRPCAYTGIPLIINVISM